MQAASSSQSAAIPSQTGAATASRPAKEALPAVRLRKPHQLFPFDLFSGSAAEGYLPKELEAELSYVRNHCMIPPFPWGQVVYHDFLVQHVLPQVPGDLAEFGIGQGGTSVFLARLAKKHGRKFLAIDSFEGLPPPDMSKDNPYFQEGDYRPRSGENNFANFVDYKSAFDVDDILHVVKAFFRDAELPPEFEQFAFVHMDSDLYDSVHDSLTKVWHLVAPGGCIAIDDFFHHAQGPARAVSDFFRGLGDQEEPPLMFVVPTYAVLIVKGRSSFLKWQDVGEGRRRALMYSSRALDGNYYSFSLIRRCQPFIQATEASVRKVAAIMATAGLEPEQREGLRRVLVNAESFLQFLCYPDDGPRSGTDILRYLLPLEDLFDIAEGNLCGMPGVARNTIEIGI